MQRIGAVERRARLVVRQRLAPETKASNLTEVARSLVGIHSSDPITVSYKQKVGDEPTGKENPDKLKMKLSQGHDATIVNGSSLDALKTMALVNNSRLSVQHQLAQGPPRRDRRRQRARACLL